MADYDGQFVWFDLLTSDLAEAKAFYSEVIGWGTEDWQGGNESYTMWTVGQQAIGGLMLLPDEAKSQGTPPHWMGYVGTSDVTTTLNKAKNLGAQIIVPPTDIPNVGAFAIIADPQGAVIALFTAAEGEAMVGRESEAGRIAWHELMTTDQSAAWDFYHALFGWEKTEAMDMGDFGIYQMFGKDGRTLGGMMTKPQEAPGPSMWLFYITVSELEAAIDKVESRGGEVINGPVDVPGGGRVAQCVDPQGAMFALHTMK